MTARHVSRISRGFELPFILPFCIVFGFCSTHLGKHHFNIIWQLLFIFRTLNVSVSAFVLLCHRSNTCTQMCAYSETRTHFIVSTLFFCSNLDGKRPADYAVGPEMLEIFQKASAGTPCVNTSPSPSASLSVVRKDEMKINFTNLISPCIQEKKNVMVFLCCSLGKRQWEEGWNGCGSVKQAVAARTKSTGQTWGAAGRENGWHLF